MVAVVPAAVTSARPFHRRRVILGADIGFGGFAAGIGVVVGFALQAAVAIIFISKAEGGVAHLVDHDVRAESPPVVDQATWPAAPARSASFTITTI